MSPVSVVMVRSMGSFGVLWLRALSTAVRMRGLQVASPPPRRADTVISLISLVQSFDFLADVASFLCLILDQRLWPDIVHYYLPLSADRSYQPGVGGWGESDQARGWSQAFGSGVRCTLR